MVVGRIRGQEGPGRDQSTDVAKHDGRSDRGRASRVGDHVRRDVGVAESAKGEAAAGNQEGSTIPHHGVLAGEEHDVSRDHQGRADNEEDQSLVKSPAEEREQNGEEGAHNVGRDGVQLLRHHGRMRVDSLDDCRREESQSLDGDVVQQEDKRGGQRDGAEDAAQRLGKVQLVENLSGTNTLRLDARNGQILLFLCEPTGSFRSVGHRHEGDERNADGDDAFDGKKHTPATETAKVVERKDAGSEKATKSSGEGCHDNVQGQTESQLKPVSWEMFTRQVVKYTSLTSLRRYHRLR